MASFTVEEISKIVKGELIGKSSKLISGAEEINQATESDITFIGNKKYASKWLLSKATVALVGFDVDVTPGQDRAIIKVKNVDQAMAKVLELFVPPSPVFDDNIHPAATIHSSAKIADTARIGAGCYIGARVEIAANVTLYPNVSVFDDSKIGEGTVVWTGTVIRERCTVGIQCIIHSNVTIGADGFGYVPSPEGRGILKVPHIGTVVIGNAVEIGAATCIDRGKFSATTIGDGTKIDNLVQIAHNCKIGRMCLIAAQVGISGSVTIGDGVIMAGQVGIKDHVTIGNKVTIGGRAGVMNDIPDGSTILGYPAIDYRLALKQWAALKRLANE